MKKILIKIIHLLEKFEEMDVSTQIEYMTHLKKIPGVQVIIEDEEI